MASKLEDLRDAIVARLQAQGDFSGITVLSRKTGDLQNQIENDLAKLGLCAVVATPTFTVDKRQTSVVTLDPVAVHIVIVQDPLLDASGVTAVQLALAAARALKLWKPDFAGASLLIPSEPASEFPISRGGEADREEDLVGWSLFFETKLFLDPL